MAIGNKIANANFFETGTFLGLGNYQVAIKNIIYRQNTTNAGEVIIAELTVETSDNPSHPAGAKRSSVFKLSTPVGLSSVKSFLYAGLGADSAEKREKADAVLPALTAKIEANEPTALVGRKLMVNVLPHKTKDGRESSKTVFSPGV